jgi:hypothetical protein
VYRSRPWVTDLTRHCPVPEDARTSNAPHLAAWGAFLYLVKRSPPRSPGGASIGGDVRGAFRAAWGQARMAKTTSAITATASTVRPTFASRLTIRRRRSLRPRMAIEDGTNAVGERPAETPIIAAGGVALSCEVRPRRHQLGTGQQRGPHSQINPVGVPKAMHVGGLPFDNAEGRTEPRGSGPLCCLGKTDWACPQGYFSARARRARTTFEAHEKAAPGWGARPSAGLGVRPRPT